MADVLRMPEHMGRSCKLVLFNMSALWQNHRIALKKYPVDKTVRDEKEYEVYRQPGAEGGHAVLELAEPALRVQPVVNPLALRAVN
jgi:hypothetical protein